MQLGPTGDIGVAPNSASMKGMPSGCLPLEPLCTVCRQSLSLAKHRSSHCRWQSTEAHTLQLMRIRKPGYVSHIFAKLGRERRLYDVTVALIEELKSSIRCSGGELSEETVF